MDASRRSEVKLRITVSLFFFFAVNAYDFCGNRVQIDAVSIDCTFDQDVLNLRWAVSLPSNLAKVISLTVIQFFHR